MKNETYERDVLKTNLLLSDLTLETDPEVRTALTDLLDRYVMSIQDLKVTEIFNRMTGASDPEEREIYTEILVDILADRKAEILGRCE